MNKDIIYQVEEKQQPKEQCSSLNKQKKRSYCRRFCSYLNTQLRLGPYQLAIDSPKSMQELESLKNRITLVLDLDETLIHSSFAVQENYDFQIQIQVQGIQFQIYVSVRPGAYEFLKNLSIHYDIILFTASIKEYADPVMDKLDPMRFAIGRMFREHCVIIDKQYVKDLTCLNKDLRKVVIIDNSAVSFQLQPENSIHIKDYFQDKADVELTNLTPFLMWMRNASDVRPVWKLQQIYGQQLKKQLQIQQQDNDAPISSPKKLPKTQQIQQKRILTGRFGHTQKPSLKNSIIDNNLEKKYSQGTKSSISTLYTSVKDKPPKMSILNSPISSSQKIFFNKESSDDSQNSQKIPS